MTIRFQPKTAAQPVPLLRSGADSRFAGAQHPATVTFLRSGADSKFARARGPSDRKWDGSRSEQPALGSPDVLRG